MISGLLLKNRSRSNAAYDWYDSDNDDYEIVYFKDDFTNMWTDGSGAILYEIDSTSNNIKPTVAADNDNVMIICETDEAGNQDIICYYSSNGRSSWEVNTIVGTWNNEISPDAVSLGELNARCTFIKNGNLYFTEIDDGGITWSAPTKVNDVNNSIPMEYRGAEVCEIGFTWKDDRNGDYDIYFDGTNSPQNAPLIDGPQNGVTGESYTYSFSGTDPNEYQVEYYIEWGDGSSEGWYGPFDSGVSQNWSHSWDAEDTYIIRCKSRDEFGVESDWSELTVTIPRNKIVNKPILNWLQYHPNWFPLLQKLLQQLGIQM